MMLGARNADSSRVQAVPMVCAGGGDDLSQALTAGDPVMVFQPIMDLVTGTVTAYEALARFPHLPGTAVDAVFAHAHRTGRGLALESLAVDRALAEGARRPPGTVLSVNVSPSLLGDAAFLDRLPADLDGVQVEITEHEIVADPRGFMRALDCLRERGAAIAVDDVGEGYAGLARVMSMSPDVLKIDRSLVAGVHDKPALAALLDAVVRFAGRTGASVCAEGIEVAEELETLADLDVAHGQGWFIGRPGSGFAGASWESRAVCSSAMHRAVAVGGHDRDDLAAALLRVSRSTGLDHLARALHGISATIGADHVELSYLDEDWTYVEAVMDSEVHFKGVRYHLDELPLTRDVLSRDTAAQVILGDPAADPGEVAWMTEDGVGSLLMVPVSSGDRVVGLFECHQVAPAPWRRSQIQAARAIAAVAGPVLDNLLRTAPGVGVPAAGQPSASRTSAAARYPVSTAPSR